MSLRPLWSSPRGNDSHARYVCQALRARKHVFVEKPLAITRQGLEEIERIYQEVNAPQANPAAAGADAGTPLLMVGFNRRFSPQVQKVKTLLTGLGEPASFVMTVNAGSIPAEHWTQDPTVGGGRIIGEACHFIDLLRSTRLAIYCPFAHESGK